MIGEILINGVPAVRMEDDGTYSPADSRFIPSADWLNDAFSPVRDSEVGDGSRPFGVAALYRAAAVLDGSSVRLANPTKPLPDGTEN